MSTSLCMLQAVDWMEEFFVFAIGAGTVRGWVHVGLSPKLAVRKSAVFPRFKKVHSAEEVLFKGAFEKTERRWEGWLESAECIRQVFRCANEHHTRRVDDGRTIILVFHSCIASPAQEVPSGHGRCALGAGQGATFGFRLLLLTKINCARLKVSPWLSRDGGGRKWRGGEWRGDGWRRVENRRKLRSSLRCGMWWFSHSILQWRSCAQSLAFVKRNFQNNFWFSEMKENEHFT